MIELQPFNISNPWTILGYTVIVLAFIMIPELNKTASQAFYYVRNTVIKRDRRVQEVDTSTKMQIYFKTDDGEMLEKVGEEKLTVGNPTIDGGTDYNLKVLCKTQNGRTREIFGSQKQYRIDENTRLGKENQVHWFDYSTTDLHEAFNHEVALNTFWKDQIEELIGGHDYYLDKTSTSFGKALDKVKPKYMLPGKGGKSPIEGGEGGGE